LLLQEIIKQAELQGIHVVASDIDVSNQASIAMHVKAGFCMQEPSLQAYFKFGL
jgi:L-amino acid N-acyltransferase YncA